MLRPGLNPIESLVIRLGPGDVAQMKDGILMAMSKDLRSAFSPTCRVVREDLPIKLPNHVVPLSPILDLHPHYTDFAGQRVMIVLPVCVGAEKAWRSLPGGEWEEVMEVEFFPGRVIMYLDHFCYACAGTEFPKRQNLQVRGFLNRDKQAARFALVHADCEGCEQNLQSRYEKGNLAGFIECEEPKDVGECQHMGEFVLTEPQRSPVWNQPLHADFSKLPKTSRTLQVSSTQFEIRIDKDPHPFSRLHKDGLPYFCSSLCTKGKQIIVTFSRPPRLARWGQQPSSQRKTQERLGA